MICNLLHNENKTQSSGSKERNKAIFSCLTEYHLQSYHAPAYGIKYVIEGTEHYMLNHKRFAVSAGHFLIVNKEQPLDVTLHSKKYIKGLCLDINPEIM